MVIAALTVIVAGAVWLSGARLGGGETVYTARFRTVGGLGVGNPVVLRGVRVGRVEAIRLASGNWVEADVKIYGGTALPDEPAAIAASASLFGEWAVTLISSQPPPVDPSVRVALEEARAAGGGKWPGATLPDIGQLTAQASRIATDIGVVANRVSTAFDSQAVVDLRQSIRNFGQVADRLVQVVNSQAEVIGVVGTNLRRSSEVVARSSNNLGATLERLDSATSQGQLDTILNSTAASATDIAAASKDLRALAAAASKHQESLVRILTSADSVMTRIANRTGTLGLMVGDSALYVETKLTMIQLRQLLSDIQANPRKYFTFSVF